MKSTSRFKPRLVFFGTADFAVPLLESLKKNGWPIETVVTRPDEPKGRRQIITPSPIKIAAQKMGLNIQQPLQLDDNLKLPRDCDLFVVCAYGQMIPAAFLKILKYGAVNVHPSLLPKYRGPSPLQTAIINGEKETGVSLILLDEKIDHGPLLAQKSTALEPDETYPELAARLARLAAVFTLEILPLYLTGQLQPQPQKHARATFTKILKRADGQINWSRGAREIYNQWRGLQPWPGVYFESKIKNQIWRIKIIKMKLSTGAAVKKPAANGALFILNKKKLGAIGGDGKILVLEKIQPAGKKIMTAEEFINGYMTN